jgi:hypothetical protein
VSEPGSGLCLAGRGRKMFEKRVKNGTGPQEFLENSDSQRCLE